MMHTYRISVSQEYGTTTRTHLSKEGVSVERIYNPLELFNKWINSDLGVALIEHIFRFIADDDDAVADLKKLVLNHAHSKHITQSFTYLEIYYEVRHAFWYGQRNILANDDEAMILIESGIKKVSTTRDHLDIITILNEKEAHGKLQETTDCS